MPQSHHDQDVAGTSGRGRSQPLTLMPIERAVPAMIFSAASIEVAFRSAILTCAISRSWALVTEPTLVLCGSRGGAGRAPSPCCAVWAGAPPPAPAAPVPGRAPGGRGGVWKGHGTG